MPLAHEAFDAAGIKVSVLRLDLIDPVISGNKMLKLQGWLQRLRPGQDRGILTMGGPWSNHLHAASFACHKLGVACTIVVKGEQALMTPTIEDCKHWGAEVKYAHHGDFNHETRWHQMAEERQLLWVPMGGEGAPGLKGVIDFFDQFTLPAVDEVWCAVGTGTTMLGLAMSSLPFAGLTGFAPGIPESDVRSLQQKLAETVQTRQVRVIKDELGRFGKTPAALIRFMNDFFAASALPTDITYTGRMFRHFLHLAQSGSLQKGTHYLLIHTGGLQGNRSMVNKGLKFTGYH